MKSPGVDTEAYNRSNIMAKAKGKEAAKEEVATESKGQGRAVTLPNGERRIDYIRNAYYNDGTTRSDIKKAINEMLKEAGLEDSQIPYQIVFAATKTGELGNKDSDPRNQVKEEKPAAE